MTDDEAIRRGIAALCALQQPDGSWRTPCEFDPSHTALWLLVQKYLRPDDPAHEAEIIRFLRHEQRTDGGWAGSPDSESALDISVLCYAALRSAGVPAVDPCLIAARAVIRKRGGLTACGYLPRLILWALGQIPRAALPRISPRLVAMPHRLNRGTFRLLEFGLVPLSLLEEDHARPLPHDRGIAELSPPHTRWRPQPTRPANTTEPPGSRWPRIVALRVAWWLVAGVGALGQLLDRLRPPVRARETAIRWILDHQGAEGSFAESLTPTVVNLLALSNIDDPRCAQAVERGMRALDGWAVRDTRGTWMPFAPSTTHDTARALEGLAAWPEAQAACLTASHWLRDHQVRQPDASSKNPATMTLGWNFGHDNPWLVDTDTTAIVLRAFHDTGMLEESARRQAVEWLLTMQDRNGGWACFTKNLGLLGRLSPELMDPAVVSSVAPNEDITARVLLALAPLRDSADDLARRVRQALAKGVNFLWQQRNPDGSWFGRWVVHFAYGTAQVIEALVACGCGDDPRVAGSLRWLLAAQNADGGWGEAKSAARLRHHLPGPSNSLVTAFCLRALTSTGHGNGPAARRAIDFLVANQQADGLWTDPSWNGVLVPARSHIRYEPSGVVLAALTAARVP